PYAGRALAVDTAHVYVTGFSNATAKLSKSDGTNLWLRTYSGLEGPSFSQAITVDANTNAYAAGQYVCFSSHGEYYLGVKVLAYATNGNSRWAWPTTAGCQQLWMVRVVGIEIDADSNVYVSAFAQPFSMYWTSKFNPAGTLLWANVFDSELADKGATGMAQDPNGFIYVCGVSWNASDRRVQSTLLKIDGTSGTNLWVKKFQGPDSSSADAVQLDSQRNIYVAGHTRGDYLTLKYNPDGNLQWSRFYGSANGADQAKAIALDPQGNVYVTGYST